MGIGLRRREGGLPHASAAPGHKTPRLTGCGDSTVREVTRVPRNRLSERNQRNADSIPLNIVSDNSQIRGCDSRCPHRKNRRYSDQGSYPGNEGHQGLWSKPSDGQGTGSALAISAGIDLKGMEILEAPLTIRIVGFIPLDVLGSVAE